MRRLTIGVVLGLTGGLLTAAPPAVSAVSAVSGVEGKDAPVVARVGDLTSRVEGSGVGSQRLTSASVKQDLDADRVSGTFVLDAAPGADSYLRVTFGHFDSGCQGHTEFSTRVVTPTDGFARDGRTLTLDAASAAAGYQDWDCAFAALTSDLSSSPAATYSVLVGSLTDVVATPVLSVGSVELLGSRKIKLVRGVPTVLEVEVENTGRADAESVRLTGKGKGLKVKKVGPEKVWSDSSATYRLVVTLTGKKASKLKLKATGGGVTATRKVSVKPQAAPAPPKPGKYSSKDGNVTFAVSPKKKIEGFRIYTQTQCGGYPDPFTYTMNYYNFPKVKIPRNGIVDAFDKQELYSVWLELVIKGGKVTKGKFSYYGPARCRAVESFTAKRK